MSEQRGEHESREAALEQQARELYDKLKDVFSGDEMMTIVSVLRDVQEGRAVYPNTQEGSNGPRDYKEEYNDDKQQVGTRMMNDLNRVRPLLIKVNGMYRQEHVAQVLEQDEKARREE